MLVVLLFAATARLGPGRYQPMGDGDDVGAGRARRVGAASERAGGAGWTLEHPRRLVGWIGLGVAVAVSVWVVVGAMRLAWGWSVGGWPDPLQPWRAVTSTYNVPLGMLWLSVVVAPVVEEIVFRGLLYRGLRQRLQVPAAVALSTIVFVVGHDAGAVVTAALLGVVTALVYERTRTLLAPIAVHAACNLCMKVFGLAAHHVAGVPDTVW